MSEDGIRERLMVDLAECSSVLDVGCGPGKYLKTLPDHVTIREALDANRAYVTEVNATVFYLGTAQEVLPKIPDRHVDGVMALDFIEHLDKPDAIRVIREMQRAAKRKVVVFTPNGFHPQEGENEWQRHRSGWTADELEHLGFKVETWKFDYGKGEGMSVGLWAVWTR